MRKPSRYPNLAPLIGGRINVKDIASNWDEVLRLMSSIKTGTVPASLILKKLANYPRQNGLAKALREIGKIERSLFELAWYQDLDLRKRVNAGLNKGEARNALARAVFFNRLGELRDRSYEDQQGRASGLTLLTAAIGLWNAVYLERGRCGTPCPWRRGARGVPETPLAARMGAHHSHRCTPVSIVGTSTSTKSRINCVPYRSSPRPNLSPK